MASGLFWDIKRFYRWCSSLFVISVRQVSNPQHSIFHRCDSADMEQLVSFLWFRRSNCRKISQLHVVVKRPPTVASLHTLPPRISFLRTLVWLGLPRSTETIADGTSRRSTDGRMSHPDARRKLVVFAFLASAQIWFDDILGFFCIS